MKFSNVEMNLFALLLAMFIVPTVAQLWTGIENDLPIEYYKPEEYEESDIDHEILLRPSRTAISSVEHNGDIKEQFFRRFEGENFPPLDFKDKNLPKQGGFIKYIAKIRQKRQEPNPPPTPPQVKLNNDIEQELATTNKDEEDLNTTTVSPLKEQPIQIADFIRFRRGSYINTESTTTPKSESRSKRHHQADGNIYREGRGLTTEEWAKFPYTPQRTNEPYDEAAASTAGLVKAPRVHFVTQRRSQSLEEPVIYRTEKFRPEADLPREARGGFYDREPPRYTSRQPRRFETDNYYPQYKPRRDEFRRDFDPRDTPDFRRFPKYENVGQRRIIYYANLPEVTRGPPNMDFRGRYRYGDIYEDRYPMIEYYSRKPYNKYRFDDPHPNKPPQPLKVATDVNVREVKKNPERRIYSDVDKKFDYNMPLYDQNEKMSRN